MTNDQKFQTIANMAAYWKERYPDAFLMYPDGREVERDDLLDYFQDLALRANSRGVQNLSEHFVRLAKDVDALKSASKNTPKPALVVTPDVPKQVSMAPIIVFAAVWPLLIAGILAGIYYVG